MIFTELPLPGAFLLEPEPREDDRGSFTRVYCEREFGDHGMDRHWVQSSLSFNRRKGTLRGMHFQAAPKAESKLVRCVRGSLFDVIVDLRPDSATYMQHYGATLSAENRLALYIPKGFAHGFQTLEDATELLYLMSEFYSPEHARGVRWNDLTFRIQWPLADPIMADRDASYPDFTTGVLR